MANSLKGLVVLSVAALSGGKKLSAKSEGVVHPNIIFVLADDLPWNSGGFGSYGTDSDLNFVTPNLDKYSGEGIKMSNYYTQESCTPSRASLMTGRYPLSIGMQFGDVDPDTHWGLNETETLLPEVLQSVGTYTNYHLGKWNLGHFTPKLLPTSRGFNYYAGYNAGSTTYWSKFHPDTGIFGSTGDSSKHFQDLTYGDNSCYSSYDGDDMHDYSTFFYRDTALNIIRNHDYDSTSLFLYTAFQATHDPFEDIDFESGIPKKYVSDTVYLKVMSSVTGRRRRQMALSLYLLDEAFNSMVQEVEAAGQEDNTYFIFASDNGGCYNSGAPNGPLRGNKGTLFEGGTKVDSFIYSASFKGKEYAGTTYGGMMHVSDWFPTILSMADISYTPPSGYELDGTSHWSTMLKLKTTSTKYTSAGEGPRSYILYNYYKDVDEFTWPDGEVRAIRSSQYKLLETYENSYSDTYSVDDKQDDDSALDTLGTCTQHKTTKTGTYTSYLFDLEADPFEENNLYDNSKYESTVTELREAMETIAGKYNTCTFPLSSNKVCYKVWKKSDNTIVPWVNNAVEGEGYPTYEKKGCDPSLLSPRYKSDDKVDDDAWKFTDDDGLVDTNPTFQPTHKPTKTSSLKSSKSHKSSSKSSKSD